MKEQHRALQKRLFGVSNVAGNHMNTIPITIELLGLWPYQSIRVRVVSLVVMNLLLISSIVPQVIFIIKHFDDRDSIMECAVPMIAVGHVVTTVFTSALNSNKMCKLLNHMRLHWELWSKDRDIHILHEYAEKARKITNLFIVGMFTICAIFLTAPVLPKIVDVLFKNGTEPSKFSLPFDYYYIDMQKYYIYVTMHMNVCIIWVFILVTAHDSFFLVNVYHSCALFAILRHKLEQLERNQVLTKSGKIVRGFHKPNIGIEYLVWCIDNHNDAIEYAELLSATYSWYFFFVTAFAVMFISAMGIQVFERANEPEIFTRFVFSTIMMLGNVYATTYICQMLMDHSISIRTYILQGKWYTLPLKAQKLLPMIIMRCNMPCKLTGANLIVISVENFTTILKTSVSYFTLLRSVYS